MKKRIWFIIPILLIISVTIIIMFLNREPLSKVSVYSWDKSDEFILCEITVESISRANNTCCFRVKDKQKLIAELEKHQGYLGRGYISHIGVETEQGLIFYYNDRLYGLMEWNTGYILIPFACSFSYVDSNDKFNEYSYLSISDYFPSNAFSTIKNVSFEESHGTYEEQAAFYGHLSENMVKLDEEKQQIRLRIYDRYNRVMLEDRCVCIDYYSKDVYVEEGITW